MTVWIIISILHWHKTMSLNLNLEVMVGFVTLAVAIGKSVPL